MQANENDPLRSEDLKLTSDILLCWFVATSNLLAALKDRYDRKNHTEVEKVPNIKKLFIKFWFCYKRKIVEKLKSTAMSIKNKMHPNVSYDKKLFCVTVISNIQFIRDMVHESSLW